MLQLIDQTGDRGRCVRQLAIEAHDAVGGDDCDADPHGVPRQLTVARQPAHAVVALPSDDPEPNQVEAGWRRRRIRDLNHRGQPA
jgi:hypothetical protein